LHVALFDAQEPGNEASWASAGMIAPSPESPEMAPFAEISLASAGFYPEFVRKVEEFSGMDVGYRKDGGIEVAFDRGAAGQLRASVALQQKLGWKAQTIEPDHARRMQPGLSEEVEGAAWREDETSLDARVFTKAALRAAERKGVQILAGNGARALWKEGGRCKGLLLDQGSVEAKWTVIAAGCFSARIDGVAPYAPVFPAKGQMLALKCEDVEIRQSLWLGHTYLVPRNDGRIIAGATIEHIGFDREVTADGRQIILQAAIRLVPKLEKARVLDSWAGLRPDSPDHLPILGPTDLDGLLIATGHFRNGILLAPITAKLIQEWICNKKVSMDWERISPMRFLETAQGKSV
jgi:glycine oxidase